MNGTFMNNYRNRSNGRYLRNFWTVLIKELWTDLYGKTSLQPETGLRGDRGVNIGKSALFN